MSGKLNVEENKAVWKSILQWMKKRIINLSVNTGSSKFAMESWE